MSDLREDELDLAAGYALGVLDAADRRRLEALLAAGHPELEAAVREMSEAAGLMAHEPPRAQPSAGLRERVLSAARAEAPAPPATARVLPLRPRTRAFSWGTAAGWAVAAAMLFVSYLGWNAANRAQMQLTAIQLDLDRVRHDLTNEQKWAAVLSSPAARAVTLGVTPDGDAKLAARAAYDPATQRAVLLFENFTPPSGKDYELWAIRGGKPASLGVIHTDAQGRGLIELEHVGDPTQLAAFAVSLEHAGGSPHSDAPGGPVVMLGKLAG